MATIAEIRKQYPEYNDLSDADLADALYTAHYSDMPRSEFNQAIKLNPSQAQGFAEGVFNVAKNIPKAPNVFDALDPNNPGRAMEQQTQTTVDDYFERKKAQGTSSGALGKFVGGTLASAPIAAIGGPVTGGMIGGYLTSESPDLQGKLIDTALGGVGGKIGEMVVGGASKALRGVGDEVVKRLQQSGVTVPPGMVYGPGFQRVEGQITHLPVVGPMVERRITKANEQWAQGAVKNVTDILGVKLPPGLSSRDAVIFADEAVSNAYESVLPKMSGRLDGALQKGLAGAAEGLQTAGEGAQKKYATIVQGALRTKNGQFTGRELQMADQTLRQEIADLAGDQTADAVKLRRALQGAQSELRLWMERQNPQHAAELRKANEAFRMLLPVDDVASRAPEGKFTPSQLSQASRRYDTSTRKGATRKGEAPQRSYAEAGQKMRTAYPNSGSATRINWSNPASLAAAMSVGVPLAAAYKGASMASHLLAGDRPAWVKPLADLIEQYGRKPAGLIGGTALAQSRK